MNRTRSLGRTRAFLFLGLALLGSTFSGGSERPTLSESAALRDFGSWQELTQGPYEVSPQVSAKCITGFNHPGEPLAPGADHFIRVYANPQAHPLMRSPRGPKFPVGSMIAKVKLKERSTHPEAVAFMVKREAGYSSASLDWEFLFFEGDPLRQKVLSADLTCEQCHGSLKEGDGVFGSYLAERQGR
jgi:Cytochrome P460